MSRGANTSSYRKRAGKHTKPKPCAAERTCLGRGHKGKPTFWSEGPWNRVCKVCAARQTNCGRDPVPPAAHRVLLNRRFLPSASDE